VSKSPTDEHTSLNADLPEDKAAAKLHTRGNYVTIPLDSYTPVAPTAVDGPAPSPIDVGEEAEVSVSSATVGEVATDAADEAGAAEDTDSTVAEEAEVAVAAEAAEDTDATAPQTPTKTHKVVRKKKRRHRKRKKRIKRVLIILLILAAIVGAVYAGVSVMRQHGENSMRVEYTEGETVTYNGTTYKYNENIVSVCVMGYDRIDKESVSIEENPGQADAIAVLALDTETGKTTAIVIPRESMVDVNTYAKGSFTGTKVEQICLAFAYGDGAETSAENVVTSVRRVLYNMNINYYVALNRQGIIPLNDAIGGVTLTPVESVPDTEITAGEEITLLGTDAYLYVQRREIAGTQGTLERMSRQAQYIKEYANQAITMATKAGGLGVLTNLYTTALDYTTTNLGLSEFSYLAGVILDKGVTDIDVITLEGSIIQGENFAEFTLDTQNVYQVVLDTFYTPVETSEND
jgi:anionic cell wall polymer biosynthesis LytR-Cps2A-Psr (LCP) family protein